ncbi:hypothetical protein [Priestia abyssalis]|uniref:hypothetical protein n=1 Tax=Priestia abyssalis TaxID=1221450 RepID=UPI000995CFF4|nr:hypothetical protein [Priestia abyssalis]
MTQRINPKIDDDMYLLKQSDLPEDLRDLLNQAHKFYFENDEKQARRLIIKIKEECLRKGIRIYREDFS